MTLFRSLDMALQRSQEAIFGEPMTFKPRMYTADVNAPRPPSPTRPIVQLTAIYAEKDISETIKHSFDMHTAQRPGVSAHLHTIEVDPRLWNVDPQKGDRFVRQSPAETWKIVSTDPQSDGRVICNVERL